MEYCAEAVGGGGGKGALRYNAITIDHSGMGHLLDLRILRAVQRSRE